AAPPRSAKPPLRPLAPPAISRASCSRTRAPASARARAAAQPVMPPPTTTTSGGPSSARRGIGGAGSSSQYGEPLSRRAQSIGTAERARARAYPWGSRPAALARSSSPGHRTVDAGGLREQAVQLELGERGGDDGGVEPDGPHELVGRRGAVADAAENRLARGRERRPCRIGCVEPERLQ